MDNPSPQIIKTTIDELRSQLIITGNYAYSNVTNLIESQIQYDAAGHMIQNEHNENVSAQIMTEVYKAANTQTLLARVQNSADAVYQIFNETISYFTQNFGELSYDIIRQGKAITDIANNVILYVLHTGNINKYIIEPAQIAITDLIAAGSTSNNALSVMENKIKERFEHYIAPVVQTELEQYYRELNTLFAENYKLVWIQYVRESSDSERRHFCERYDYALTGNAYHIDEVKQWPSDNGNEWDGMIPNTNQGNILINAGGYNCLHSFNYIAASKVSPTDMSRAKSKGFI